MNSWWNKFRRQQQAVDHALRAATPSLRPADAALHDSIMRSVRAARRQPEPRREVALGWWLSGAMAASLAAAALWLHPRPPAAVPTPQKLAAVTEMASAPGAALELGAQAPALFMAPLTNEMARVDQDLHSATAVLLESFP